MHLEELLKIMILHHASDLHLSSGTPPIIRIDNELKLIEGSPLLEERAIKEMLFTILPPKQVEEFDKKIDVDFSFEISQLSARFRANAFHQERGISIAIRHIPITPPSLANLGLPDILYNLCNLRHGLVLVTGPTGSGKSTTLAAMIDHINSTFAKHIITIEDPIEYLHQSKMALIQQREVKKHTGSFDKALRSALREDPDYMLVGEMRDLETMRLALTAAETGHLVFATLHTNSAAETIDRIVDVFPSSEKSLIRSMLANALKAVISQHLLRKIGDGRVVAQEIMICNTAIRNLIRENKIHQIYSAIQTGRASGMQTLASNVKELIEKNILDRDEYSHLLIE
jgi:twitching motility protein PilT